MKYHNNAKLTIFQRKELARRINDGEEVTKVAKDFNVSRRTAYKWAGRESFHDASSRPKKYGYPQCRWKPPKEKPNIFYYEKKIPGELVHLDTFRVYSGGKRYVGYVAIDDCTRYLAVKILDYKTQDQARHFLDIIRASFPFKIQAFLTDNGTEFTGSRKRHLFQMGCIDFEIDHRTTKPNSPKTNGKAERVIRTLKEGWYRKKIYNSLGQAAYELAKFVHWYNNHRVHMSLKMTPLQKLKMVA